MFDREIIDLTDDSIDRTTAARQLRKGQNALQPLYIGRGRDRVAMGDFIQVRHVQLGQYDIEFVKIVIITERRSTSGRAVRGIPFIRNRMLFGSLPKKPNEVCKVLHYHLHSQQAENIPVLIDVDPVSIIRKCRLVITNATYPTYQASSLPSGTFVCRWQLRVYFTIVGGKTRPEEEALERICWEEADRSFQVADDSLCTRWRNIRVRGGSWDPDEGKNAAKTSNVRAVNQKYTLFDSFSGAGGVSSGAQSAGFKIKFAVDQSPEVWHTYRMNFPSTKLYKMSVDKFVQESRGSTKVDVLHLSPPCQYFSPAHTHESVHDEANIFALFGCNELINRTRPRLITLEQTFGLTHGRHHLYLRALLGDMTQYGYSVRWKVVRLCTWGLAQDRKRLIVLAAGPGEKLPSFPRATHGEGQGLKPYTTIGDAIRDIRPGDDLHNPRSVQFQCPRVPFNPNRLAGTITTQNNEAYHPSGLRGLTLREFAQIQGFPMSHRFRGNKTAIRKQIGNAFPPNTVKVLYKHLEDWLLKQDGMRRYRPNQDDAVNVDDSVHSVHSDSSSEAAWSPNIDDAVHMHGRRRQNRQIIDLT